MDYTEVLDFWFAEDVQPKWFVQSEIFDQEIRDRFFKMYQAAFDSQLEGWLDTVQGYLAIVILLDQFPRNMFRNEGQAFMSDSLALHYAREALSRFELEELSQIEQVFLCMPFMHSESLAVQEESLKVFERIGRERNIRYAKAHYEVIAQFGRFPFRNQALNRRSTQAEQMYLATHKNF
ncbi:MAG: DUF924 family protein [Aerococcaceae bacterium]|nr:DUF924 family protein [Aerococcaceae bacterium]